MTSTVIKSSPIISIACFFSLHPVIANKIISKYEFIFTISIDLLLFYMTKIRFANRYFIIGW